MSDVHKQVGDLTQFTAGNEVAIARYEDAIESISFKLQQYLLRIRRLEEEVAALRRQGPAP